MPLPASPIIINSDEQQSSLSNESKKATVLPIIIFVIIYGIVLYGIVGYFIYKENITKSLTDTNQTNGDNQSFPLPQFVEISERNASGSFEFITSMTTDKLPIVTLQRNDQIIDTTPYNFLEPMNVKLSDDIAKKASAYRFEHLIFIGPKEWYGKGFITENGITIYLYPTKNTEDLSGPYLKIYIAPKGSRLALSAGSQYFQWIRSHASELQIENALLPVIPMSSSSAITKHLITFLDTITAGPTLETSAAAFSDVESHLQDKQWSMIYMEANLPKEERQVAQEFINIFIQQYELDKK